jgi:NADH:ubiquinone oxidoreductase subunit 6 (subunit J)
VIAELLALGLIITALLAVNLDDPVYSLMSLACVLLLSSLLYAENGAFFAAVFQSAAGIGTIAILLVISETLDEDMPQKRKRNRPVGTIVAAILLSIPVLYFTIPVVRVIPEPISGFPLAFWELRSVDVVLQGIVILVLATGMAILLKSEREGRQ